MQQMYRTTNQHADFVREGERPREPHISLDPMELGRP